MRFNSNVRRTEMPPLVELPRRAAELAEQGADVIRVDQGAVNLAPPEAFVERVVTALSEPEAHRYSPDPGLPELRAALSRYAAESLDVECDPHREVIVTAGANQACFACLMTLVEPGDEVLLPSPWYFNHVMTLTALGAIPVPVPTKRSGGFAPHLDEIAALVTPRTRGVALVNPNNPTGVCYPEQLIRDLVELAKERNLWILSDQTYHELCYAAASPLSPAAVRGSRDHVITVSSFSKSLGLAGWRLGFLVGSAELVDEVLKIQDSSVICASRIGQEGLVAALVEAEEHMKRVRGTLRERRDRLVASLEAAGLDRFVKPEGALFLFLDLPGEDDDLAFCHRLLEEHQLVAVPGRAFGPEGAGSIRISFGSVPTEHLDEVVRRIGAIL
jgi:aspartate/methionine/tyrosine aminotransferase